MSIAEAKAPFQVDCGGENECSDMSRRINFPFSLEEEDLAEGLPLALPVTVVIYPRI